MCNKLQVAVITNQLFQLSFKKSQEIILEYLFFFLSPQSAANSKYIVFPKSLTTSHTSVQVCMQQASLCRRC